MQRSIGEQAGMAKDKITLLWNTFFQGLLDDYLIPCAEDKKSDDVESIVFYRKMKGDYLRYLAEVATEDDDKSKLCIEIIYQKHYLFL